MIDAGPAVAVSRLRSALSRSDGTRTDAQLLAAYIRERDADAFATLVYRHGPSVRGVCRRVTGHDHDADDAFQAVFLVLARRAADVTPPNAVGSWLYGVAFRTAQGVRRMAAKRRARVTPVATVPDLPECGGPETPDAELAAVLDAEIAQLPDQYRAAVVLCELNGVSRPDAAKRLGVAEGTLSSRLAEARKRLAAGLQRKGFALPAVLGAVCASSVSGSESVFPVACRLGQLTAAGEPIPAGVPVTLADRVTRIMDLKKLTTLSLLTACAALVLGAGWMTSHPAFADDKPAVKAEGAKPVAQAKPVNRLIVWRQGELFLMDPDGKNEKRFLDRDRKATQQAVLSPDGTTVAWLMHITAPPGTPIPVPLPKNTVHIRKIDEKEATEIKVSGLFITWSPDGRELLLTDFERGAMGVKVVHTVVDVASKKETVLSLPDGHTAHGYTPDGKGFITLAEFKRGKPGAATFFVSRDGKDLEVVSDPAYSTTWTRLSPDGKTLLFMGMKTPVNELSPIDAVRLNRLYLQPIGGEVVELADAPKNAELIGFCWSPDGKRIAYTWRQVHAEKAEEGKADERETECHLSVCDADGKNHKTILTEKGKAGSTILLDVDWR